MMAYEERSQTIPCKGVYHKLMVMEKVCSSIFFVEDEEIVGSRMKVRGFIYC